MFVCEVKIVSWFTFSI